MVMIGYPKASPDFLKPSKSPTILGPLLHWEMSLSVSVPRP
ncbi:hypothetical protein CIY_06010 [Butyrivibrio fibrisolvens 16/4]|nr:hypothetical protein CIY_06010 [Butyrivibrio fibrisolvens 16/4]